MRVKIEAHPELEDVGDCIKREALEAVIDEATAIEGDFVRRLFRPGPWERFKRCLRPKASVEFSVGSLYLARGEYDYLDFAEALLIIDLIARGRIGMAFEIARITGVGLRGRYRERGIYLSFAGFHGEVELIDDKLVFHGEEDDIILSAGEFLDAERRFLESLTFELKALFEECSEHGLERAYLENTASLRLLLKVMKYGNRLDG
ncbi:hypothetical protein [Palaeococcus ferrophilus]|uniref:hypothetical protein n=1 Tax=Palaeococcus ferrophilus TaxID=83868 RepID=UPI00064EED39|nr:hypothetical protein [Palaeococcus ferrophilus]